MGVETARSTLQDSEALNWGTRAEVFASRFVVIEFVILLVPVSPFVPVRYAVVTDLVPAEDSPPLPAGGIHDKRLRFPNDPGLHLLPIKTLIAPDR